MQARMKSPVMIIPSAMQALQALSKSSEHSGLPARTLDLIQLRASQINGCSVCTDRHSREAKKHGERDERLNTLVAWRETPYFTDAERAALALTEAATRISDRSDAVPDEIWDEAARYYDERALTALVVQIAAINAWNRLNVLTRQLAGEWLDRLAV
jgi:AhpD family alkylhydroperoxidase